MKTYFWDFFGPRAEGTARHFEKHLLEFLGTHAVSGCETGLSSEGQGHHAVYCRSPTASGPIETLLRPKRAVDG